MVYDSFLDLFGAFAGKSQPVLFLKPAFGAHSYCLLLSVRTTAIEAIATDTDGQALLRKLEALGLQKGIDYKNLVFGYCPSISWMN